MKSKILKSFIYFIFSAVFITSTAFFINNNFSLRIYLTTFLFILRNYTWIIILFSQFIYIYRIDELNIKDILIFTGVIVTIYLFLHSLFDEIDYTSLGRNQINELYIEREELISFNIYNYELIRDFVFKVRKFKPIFILFFLNPVLLLFIKEKTGRSSFISSLFFSLLMISYVFANGYIYSEFYLLLLFLAMKFRGHNETY